MSDPKEFFEQLAGVNYDSQEFEPQLVKATTRKKKEEPEEEEAPRELLSEEFDDAEGHLQIDVYQDENNIIIESTIAGVETDDMDISITPESVTVKGTRKRQGRIRKEDYLYQECFWGRFSRSVILPQEIDPEKAQAALKNGVLRIVLPKIQRSKSKKIKVKLD